MSFIKEAFNEYFIEPGYVSSYRNYWGAWFCVGLGFDKEVRFYNNTEYPVHIEVKELRGTFIRSLTCGAFQGQGGAELEDAEIEPQYITIGPKKTTCPTMLPVSLSRGRYKFRAFINNKDLGTRHFTTAKGPIFQPRHYERVKDAPDQRPPWFPALVVEPETQIEPEPVQVRRKFLWIF